ncbi:MAG: DUF6164 family protein [Thiohalomonadaceae bacterium]
MPILLFRLNRVPEDEADDIRHLLNEHHIKYYETEAGRWGISLAAIWLHDDSLQLERAQQLIDDYQTQREQQARSAYNERQQNGQQETILKRFLQRPVQLFAYALAILAIIYFTLMPFFSWP